LFGSFSKPVYCLDIILWRSLAVLISPTEFALSLRTAFFGSGFDAFDRICVTLLGAQPNTSTQNEQQRKQQKEGNVQVFEAVGFHYVCLLIFST
jgi:hypothetical protein